MRSIDFFKKLAGCLFCWHVKRSPEEKIRNAKAALAQSLGLREKINVASNEALADIAKEFYKLHKLPLLLQVEISECLYLPIDAKALIVRKHRVNGKYLDTFEVIYQQLILCKKMGWTSIVMIAHPLHMWRCIKIAEKIAKELGIEIEISVPDVSSVPFDSLSEQWQTRSAWQFRFYEFFLARPYCLLTGRI